MHAFMNCDLEIQYEPEYSLSYSSSDGCKRHTLLQNGQKHTSDTAEQEAEVYGGQRFVVAT